MTANRSRQTGYSLIEMLVVVAIIGTLTLVTIPAFVNLRNSNKMKSAMRSFTTDLRAARQLAITRSREVKVTFKTGADQREYDYMMGDRAYGSVPDLNWVPLTGPGSSPPQGSRKLEDVIYFPADSVATPQTFVDANQTADNRLDVIFYPDGRAQMPSNATKAIITIKTDMNIPKAQYAIEVTPSGRVLVQ